MTSDLRLVMEVALAIGLRKAGVTLFFLLASLLIANYPDQPSMKIKSFG